MSSIIDIDSCRTPYESNREWSLRRSFLCHNASKEDSNGSVLSRNRLLCLANCFVNVRCYGCHYPDMVMQQLRDMTGPGMESEGKTVGVSGIGLVPRVSFVRASAESSTRSDEQQMEEDDQPVSRELTTRSSSQFIANAKEIETGIEWLPPASKKARSIIDSISMAQAVNSQPASVSTGAKGDVQRTTALDKGVSIASIIKSKPDNTNATVPRQFSNASSDGGSEEHFSELEARFVRLASIVRELVERKGKDHNMAEVVQMCVDRTKMAMAVTYDDLPGAGFLCRLSIDFVEVATASATSKKVAKHAAFVTAAEVFKKPYLRIEKLDGRLTLSSSTELRSKYVYGAPSSPVNRELFEASLRLSGSANTSSPDTSEFKDSSELGGATRRNTSTNSTIQRQAPSLPVPHHQFDDNRRHPPSNSIPRQQRMNNFPSPQQTQWNNISGQRPRAQTAFNRNKDAMTPKPVPMNLDDVLAEFVVRRPEETSLAHNSLNVLNESAGFNKLELAYEFTDISETSVRCQAILSGHVVADVTGSGRATAKLTAAEEALAYVQSRCPTIIYKRTDFDDSPAGNAVARDNVLGVRDSGSTGTFASSSVAIPDSNVGSRLLRKMGWKGVGGVGAVGREGIAEPVSMESVVNREGLGLGTSMGVERDLAGKVGRVIENYLRKDEQEDLVFAPTFSKEERAVIHVAARKYGLRTRSHGLDSERFLVLSRKRTPIELVAHVRANGGETYKYILKPPTGTSGTKT